MNVAIDAVGIREGGGAAILEEILDWLPRVRPDWRWHVFLLDRSLRKFDDPPVGPTVTLESTRRGNSGFGRIFWVNHLLPRRLHSVRADVLFSFANIAPFAPTIPQVVLCHQTLILFTDALSDFPWWARFRFRFLRYCVRRGFRSSRSIIVQTENMRDRLYQDEEALRGRVEVIPSGFRTPPPQPVVRDSLRDVIDQSPHPRLLYVSLLRYNKNHPTLLRAMTEVIRSLPDARLFLTIDPQTVLSPDVANLHHNVVESVANSELKRHVLFLGHLSPCEVTYALQNSDVMVFPSLAESFGLPLAEAMAAGCPIAAADLPYAHDVAASCADFFPPTSPSEIAACVVQLANDADRRAHLRAEGLVRARQFSYDKLCERLATVFERAATG